jgi:hypothetical protein
MSDYQQEQIERKLKEVESLLDNPQAVDPATLFAALRILVEVIKYLRDIKR